MVDDLAVLAEGNILHSVDICRIIHIIVALTASPISPQASILPVMVCLPFLAVTGFSSSLRLLPLTTPLPGCGQTRIPCIFGARVSVIFSLKYSIGSSTSSLSVSRTFKMEMRTPELPVVSAIGDNFSFFDRELVRVEEQVYVETFLFVLLLFDISGDRRGESLQMGVNGCRSIRMC